MTGEEMERAIEIILNNQANYEIQFERTSRQIEQTTQQLAALTESQAILTESQASLTESQASLTNSQAILTESHAALAESQAALIDSQASLTESHGTLADTQNEFMRAVLQHIESQHQIDASLRESQARTDERLDSLINTVERFISEGRNG